MPTVKQKRVAAKIGENKGNISKTMREVGYSPKTAHNPKALTDSKGWDELVDAAIPETKAAKVLGELLGAYSLDMFVFAKSMPDKEIEKIIIGIKGSVLKKIEHGETQKRAYFYFPNPKAKKDGLELYFKIKGKFAPDKVIDEGLRDKVDDLSNRLKNWIGEKKK